MQSEHHGRSIDEGLIATVPVDDAERLLYLGTAGVGGMMRDRNLLFSKSPIYSITLGCPTIGPDRLPRRAAHFILETRHIHELIIAWYNSCNHSLSAV